MDLFTKTTDVSIIWFYYLWLALAQIEQGLHYVTDEGVDYVGQVGRVVEEGLELGEGLGKIVGNVFKDCVIWLD